MEGGVMDGAGLEARLAEAERKLAETEALLRRAERRTEIDRVLLAEGAIDLESARLLVEAAMEGDGDGGGGDAGGEAGGASAAVAAIRERKPFLFRPRGGETLRSGAMRAQAPAADPLEELADAARASGDRGALLRYLRMRRGC